MIAIHQFSPSVGYGDAVSTQLRLRRRSLRTMGFCSEIYAEQFPDDMAGIVKPLSSYVGSPHNLLILNHQLGFENLAHVLALPDRKLLSFNNITPARFFPPGQLKTLSTLGRNQLIPLRHAVEAAVCNSEFDADELRLLGYRSVIVAPYLFDLPRLAARPWTLPSRRPGTATILMVGRLIENKFQHRAIDVMRHLRDLYPEPVELVLIGLPISVSYEHRLRTLVSQRGLEQSVRLCGQVSDAELRGWYRSSDALLCLSAHEGFGVPLIEAMAFGLPVVASRSSAVHLTLGNSGVQLVDRNPRRAAAALALLLRDPTLKARVLLGQRQRLQDFTPAHQERRLREVLAHLGITPRYAASQTWRAEPASTPAVQLEGPFETSYSLAVLNRELARALDQRSPGQVALFATEGPGDYKPQPANLSQHADLEPLWRRGRAGAQPELLIRNLYPPRVADMSGRSNLLYFGWEESMLPNAWVRDFNRRLTGIVAMSDFVRKTLIDNGVEVPIATVGVGVDHLTSVTRARFQGKLGSGFKFLHVSSAFPRKGLDVLLESFADAFTQADDVSLVIKTFPNPHNNAQQQVAALRATRPNCPPIVLIDRDLPGGQLLDLYARCSALVAPSRGEGFGLPMAEAMWLGLPVVTTAFGGQTDFCDSDTAWMVDFSFERSQSHLASFDSVWVEPDRVDLTRALREVYSATPAARRLRTDAARARVTQSFTWGGVADRVAALPRAKLDRSAPLRIGWVSSWNTKCGIAIHSAALVRELERRAAEVTIFASRANERLAPDGDGVVRCWDDRLAPQLDELEAAIRLRCCEVVVFQFNFGFYSLPELGALLERLRASGIRCVVLLHSTQDVRQADFEASLQSIVPALRGVDRLLVHGITDLNRLKGWGLVANVTLFPHGVAPRGPSDRAQRAKAIALPPQAPILACYGFMLPHKGILELVEAMPAVLRRHPRTRLLLVNAIYPVESSSVLAEVIQRRIAQLGLTRRVIHIGEFLREEESAALLEAAHLLLYPYQHSQESSSAAVRSGLATRRPVVCTPLDIFSDVRGVVSLLPGTSPAELASGIVQFLSNPRLLDSAFAAQQRWLDEHAWPDVAGRIWAILRAPAAAAPSAARSIERAAS